MEKEEIIIDEKVKKSFRNNIVLSCIWLVLSPIYLFLIWNIDIQIFSGMFVFLWYLVGTFYWVLMLIHLVSVAIINIILAVVSIILSKKNKKAAYIVNIFAIVFYLISVVALLPLICSIYVLPLLILGIVLGVFFVKSNVKYAKSFKKKKISNL